MVLHILIRRILRHKSYYFIYNHRLLFVVGLVFSRSLAYQAIVNVIMLYLTTGNNSSFVRSTVLTNILDSLSSLLEIFMAHSATSFVGRFRTLLFSTTAYISGVMLLFMFNPYDVTWLVVLAIILLALGRSGDTLLKNLLIDLVNRTNKSRDQSRERSLACAKLWWCLAHVSGAIVAILWVVPFALGGVYPTWRITFLICLITMTVNLMIFCSGHNVYHQSELTERPIVIFFRVFHARIQKLRKSSSRRSTTNTSTQESSQETRMPENEGVTQERLDIKEQKDYKKDMKVIRSLLKMFPMWGMFLVVSLISATGNTFFYEQFSYLDDQSFPVQIFSLIQGFSGFAITFLYHITCLRRNVKIKIGIGMLCSVITCVLAWQIERSGNVYINFVWLIPQFCMLGCMEGLTEDGVLKFFKSQTDKRIQCYAQEYMEFVLGLGKLVNIFLILVLHEWFGDNIYENQLSRYYTRLVFVCSINFIIYCCVAKCFYRNAIVQDSDSDSHSAHDDDS